MHYIIFIVMKLISESKFTNLDGQSDLNWSDNNNGSFKKVSVKKKMKEKELT